MDAKGSKNITSRVSGYLRGKGMTVLDLSAYYEGTEPRELMVNPVDGHPNERVHAYVSDLLYEALGEIWAGAR